MDHKKDIGKLIKEQLANTEVEPNKVLWTSIEKTLDDNSRKRGAFLWLWGSLLFVLGIFFIIYLTNDSKTELKNNPKIEIPIVDIQSKTVKEKPIQSSSQSYNQLKNKISEDNLEIENTKLTSSKTKLNSKTEKEQSPYKRKNSPANRSKSSNQKKQLSTNRAKTTNQNKNETISNETANFSDRPKKLRTNKSTDTKNKRKEVERKKVDKDAIEKLDSIFEKTKPTKEQVIDEIKKKKKDIPQKKWLISIQAGPNALEYLIDNNPFQASLRSGVLQSKTSFSYGAMLNYPIDSKFTFRLGLKNSNFRYQIEEAMSDVTNTGNLKILTDPALERNGSVLTADFINSISPPNTFRIDQEINYVEIPIQLLYRIRDNRIKIDAILGLSGMLLNKNQIKLDNFINSIEVGSGAYLKKTALSSSIGLGFRYTLSDRITLDLEPTLQYQFGAFEKSNKNLRPLILNLNAGATIKLHK